MSQKLGCPTQEQDVHTRCRYHGGTAPTMNSRWLEIWPAAPLTATRMVFFHVAVSRGSSCIAAKPCQCPDPDPA